MQVLDNSTVKRRKICTYTMRDFFIYVLFQKRTKLGIL